MGVVVVGSGNEEAIGVSVCDGGRRVEADCIGRDGIPPGLVAQGAEVVAAGCGNGVRAAG